MDRYARQMRFAPLGEKGQQRLSSGKAAVVGCGALGTVVASGLVRAGVGTVRIIDRDLVEWSNLQRQVLFDESDAAESVPKAIAAAEQLRRVNSTVSIEPIVSDLHSQNIASLLDDVDVILDGSDNFETRFLLNDFALSERIPWVFAASVGSVGQTMTILPDGPACLQCLIADVPPAGSTETCDTAGILSPASGIIGQFEVAEAIKILSDNLQAVAKGLLSIDVWSNQFKRMSVDGLSQKVDCPACRRREFRWLHAEQGSQTARLCGRNAVHVSPGRREEWDWDRFCDRLSMAGELRRTPFWARLSVPGFQVHVFRDGRAIIQGTDNIATARSLYARYVGL